MAQKNLKELLKEEQEPFHLKDFIADRKLKFQLKKLQPTLKKQQKPISKNPSFSTNFCKNACFFSFNDSPDNIKKSPLFDFATSPVNKSPTNRVLLNVPAKTASLLLEAAMRIQKHSRKPKNSGFGLLIGSVLKRLTHKNRTQKKIKGSETGEIKKNEEIILVGVEDKLPNVNYSSCSSCSCSCSYNGRLSSLDLQSSSSGRSFDDDDDDGDGDDDNDEFEFANLASKNGGDFMVCLSPSSPFRFALHKSPSPDHRSPVFQTPAKSPARRKIEDLTRHEQEGTVKFQVEEDEEDKEQNSPVSILDPPFQDDYDGQDEDAYDIDCSYAFVQRAKQQLLQKLQRFEKLAKLDPIELEKRMMEEEEGSKGGEDLVLEQSKDYEEYDFESFTFDEQRQVDELIEDVIRKLGFQDIEMPGIKRLVYDIIIEEERAEISSDDSEKIVKRVCKRLESWKEVECNTIDMMVEMDLRREVIGSKKPQEHIGEVSRDIDVSIFSVLVEELLEDLAYFA